MCGMWYMEECLQKMELSEKDDLFEMLLMLKAYV